MVEILYRRESLPDSYSLMDIAYIYTWKRNGPMRFYYRIHVPTTLKTVLPSLKASSEPIRDSVPGSYKKPQSPELLDAVGLRPRSPREITVPNLSLELEKEKIKDEIIEKTTEDETEVKLPCEDNKPPKTEERLSISPEEDTAVSQLLALSSSQPKREPSPVGFVKLQALPTSERQEVTASVKPPTGNGGVFKVPQTMTKRFVFNGGKLVAVKPKSPGGRTGKGGDKTKTNKKMSNGDMTFDRLTNPLGLMGVGPVGVQGGKLPPGSPRPPPNFEKNMTNMISNGPLGIKGGKLPPGSPRPSPNSENTMKTKYASPSALLINRLTPEVTVSQNKNEPESPVKTLLQAPCQVKQNLPPLQSICSTNKPQAMTNGKPSAKTNGQPAHRKEINRLEQIVQNCLKKETLHKSACAKSGKETGVQSDACGVKRSGTLNVGTSELDARAGREDASIRPADHVAANPSRTDQVDIAKHKESQSSILKRKLNDPPFNRRLASATTASTQEQHDGLEEAKRRRLVTPDVSIELMANPAKEKVQKDKKREPSDLSTLTKRFLNDIQRMKKLDSELKINKVDQMCASTVKIEKVPAPPSHLVTTPKSSPNGNETTKGIEGSEFNSENDQLFIDIRNKCEALKRKNSEPVSVAIERVTEDKTPVTTCQASPSKGDEPPTITSENIPKTGTHKKLPRLIEINAPPRPKLMPGLISSDSKQKTGIKMTTVRKEVPIGKEGPLVRRDSNGALDLSSGVSPPNGTSKSGNKSPYQRSSSAEKSSTSSSLSPLTTMTSFPMPDTNRSPIRIPTVKPKTSPTPRPSSLSSSSPSPPAEPRTNSIDVFPPTYHQLYRHQMELMQSRILASQVNNNNWSRDPLSAKKFEDWMRNVMNLHPLMFPSQVSPEAGRK